MKLNLSKNSNNSYASNLVIALMIYLSRFVIAFFLLFFVVLILSPTILLTYAGPAPDQNASPPLTVNASNTFRIAVIGDVDSNPGLTEQLDLMNKYHVQTLLLMETSSIPMGKLFLMT